VALLATDFQAAQFSLQLLLFLCWLLVSPVGVTCREFERTDESSSQHSPPWNLAALTVR
jgi:hypothetical protein